MDKNKYTNNKAYERGEQTRKEIYKFVVDYIQENGYPPTMREIANSIYLSASAVCKQLRTMFDLGILETSDTGNCNRAIRVPGYEFKRAVVK